MSGHRPRQAPLSGDTDLSKTDETRAAIETMVDNWVMVDFAGVLAQLGSDVFNGEGWERFDMREQVDG